MEKTEFEANVMEFITKFDASRDPALWKKLVEEESNEVVEAFGNLMKEVADLMYVVTGYELVGGDPDVEFDPETNQSLKVLEYLDMVPMEMREEAFRRVHKSNMSKLGEDGKPIKREDGKILKGPNYKPADMSDIITY